jgi:ribosomal protein S27E
MMMLVMRAEGDEVNWYNWIKMVVRCKLMPPKKLGESHSAFDAERGRFIGTITYEHKDGSRTSRDYKIRCPACQAEGDQLEHANWYMAKETGENLRIRCKDCGLEVDTEDYDSKEFKKWKVML